MKKILLSLCFIAAFIPCLALSVVAEDVVTIGIYQEPETLNSHIGVQTVVTYVHKPFAEYLIDVNEKGEYYPVLAKEVPSVENGGVSADGLTITYKLKEGVKWSDGEPFTSADVKFTWEAIMNEKNLVKSRSGYDLMESVETPDDYTVVVKYKEFYAPYLTRFSPVLPKHILGDLPDMNDAPYNRIPVGTGPFRVTNWVSGDHIEMEKNPYYREADKVKLDKVFFKIIPSREVGIAQINAGDIDCVWDLIEAQIPEMEKNPEITLCLASALTSERLILNFSTPVPPNNGNPDYPHPILADLKVRQAIQYAIDRQLIVDKLLYGKAKVTAVEIPDGWAANHDIIPTEYDPEKAVQLLEEAGWKVGADGIREKDGIKMRLKIATTSGNQLREQVEQVLVAMMKKVGIDMYIENVPSSVFFGSWANDADRKKGRYDIMMYTTGPGIDPQEQFSGYFHSKSIPTEANGGAGFNYTRHRDAELDQYIDLAGSSPSMEVRAEAYRKAQARIAEILPHIYLYRRLNVDAFRSHVKGWTVSGYGIIDAVSTWDIANWYLEK
ncbi:extracellular solute-binding protein family 5 [Candidatus Vecturithrix granuli]|uniref:Extracellular solute-binding protein family 5 n=1 Tax=Vecturithrix granuli TaxID=1499967 RepID=A0A081BWN7_VECG1|nr:extracellular solute-binding protein family 5 [Candidatus Vecturithrix granuli]